MTILVLGGTQFIGRQIVLELLAAGHVVSVLNRRLSPDDLPPKVERLRGNRDRGRAGLAALVGREWDTCIDVSGYTAVHVRSSVEALGQSVKRYVYVSAVSVYGDPSSGPVDETTPLRLEADESATEVVGELYGRLKVTCERIVRETFNDRATILRPQIVAGPRDPTARLSYWIQRAMLPGPMLAPGDGTDHLQVIDLFDLARFTRHVVEHDVAGTFNLAGERVTWSSFVEMLAPKDVVWVPSAILDAAGLTYVELPVYRAHGSPRSSLMHVCNQRAVQNGLVVSPMAATVQRVRTYVENSPYPTLPLSPEFETDLIRRATQALQ